MINFLEHLTLAQFITILAHFVLTCSLAQNLLPPTEYFSDCSERFQKHYKLFVKLVAFYGSLNFRGAMVSAYLKRNGNGNGTPPPPDSNAASAGK